MYQTLLKPFLFLFSPEKAHHLALRLFSIALAIPLFGQMLKLSFKAKGQIVQKAGLSFKNNVGLAAGFDKDGRYMNLMAHMGFWIPGNWKQ